MMSAESGRASFSTFSLSENVLKLGLPDSARIIAQEVLKLAKAE